ncbi:hypothetical protein DMC30DRAFT_449038 [Rhodotorula diobovata]|uniref:F-box domain-containing protein n=1 Tax=Rhodotorula diobovata TaxID=5288 RepID=A0A5C5FN33_9BASI|nr:hypothetical protein DMC30DRAFT_449038 [Rhodotorula diobovata]
MPSTSKRREPNGLTEALAASLGKQERKQRLRGEEAERDLRVDLFLSLPFDLLAEICRELALSDLISFTRTSRKFRQLFLSPTSRQLRSLVRARDGYLKPDSMTELAFAVLLTGDDCQVAGCTSSKKVTTHWALRGRLCNDCVKEYLVSRAQALKKIDMLHKKALLCTPYSPGSGSKGGSDLFVKHELEETSVKLFGLEANDKAGVVTTKSRRSAGKTTTSSSAAGRAVDEFFNKEQARAQQAQKDAETVTNGLKAVQALQGERRQRAEKQAELDELLAEQALNKELKRDHGWTDEHLDYVAGKYDLHGLFLGSIRRPKVLPSEDLEVWDAYLEEVDKLLQKHKYEARVGPARDARLERLRSYYPALKDSLTNELDGVLPGFDEFKDLPAVKELWEGEDAQLDDSAWPTQVAVAEQALRDFAEEMRVHAIRIILAADSGGALTRLKADSPKIKSYPAKKYGAEFFTCITSQFICSPSGSSENVIAPYPSVLEHKPAGKGVVFFLESGLSFKAVCALRAILVAAELDEDTATPGDLDKLGRAFSWPECPKKCCKSRTWLDMVTSLVGHGPAVAYLKNGARAKLVCGSLADGECAGASNADVALSDASSDS